MALTYFKLDCFDEATSPISSSTKRLRPEAFEALKSYASEVRKVLEFQPESSDTIVLAWKHLATWCDLIPTWKDVQAFVRYAKDIRVRINNLLFRSLVESMSELASQINTSLPKYSHFCNDEDCNKQLCTRHLLNHPGQGFVHNNVTHMLETITTAKQLLREWPISEPDKATFTEEIERATWSASIRLGSHGQATCLTMSRHVFQSPSCHKIVSHRSLPRSTLELLRGSQLS